MNVSKPEKSIWSIGHSTRPLDELVAMLQSSQIEIVADIRSSPGSTKFPQFNKEALQISLPENKIQYIHLKRLGGRRKVNPDSKNTVWRHPAFRGYADYMETDTFKEGIRELEKDSTETAHRLYVFRGSMVALSPLHGFRLFKSTWLESNAHYGCWKRRRTSLYRLQPGL